MKLSIRNLNIVRQADITVNGLAVIAGENGTGKSTIGKTLFATLKATPQRAETLQPPATMP